MRLFSTPESANCLEFTWLSFIESLVACAISILIVRHLDTYTHIIIAICLVPLLLLKTNRSIELGLKWFESGYDILVNSMSSPYVQRLSGWLNLRIDQCSKQTRQEKGAYDVVFILVLYVTLRAVFFIIITTILALGILVVATIFKVFATIFGLMCHPVVTISSIPENWFRIVFSTDTMHPPEVMPGLELHKPCENIQPPTFLSIVNVVKSALSIGAYGIGLAYSIMLVLWFPLALLYRWSLKSTFPFYLPFLWLSHKSSGLNEQEVSKTSLLDANLKQEYKVVDAKIKIAYASVVLVAAIASAIGPIIFDNWVDKLSGQGPFLSSWIDYWLFSPNMLMSVVPVTESITVNSWHVTRLTAAVITIGLFVYVNRTLISREDIPNYRQDTAPFVLFWCRFSRTSFSLFTLGCGFYLVVWPVLKEWNWVTIAIKWLPAGS